MLWVDISTTCFICSLILILSFLSTSLCLTASEHPTYLIYLLGFKPTMILNYAIICLDEHTSCINSSDYSYCSSELTLAIHIALASNHFLYSVTLDTCLLRLKVWWYSECLLEFNLRRNWAANVFYRLHSLYTTFVVYFMTTDRHSDFIEPKLN